jgi:hypothetical protein
LETEKGKNSVKTNDKSVIRFKARKTDRRILTFLKFSGVTMQAFCKFNVKICENILFLEDKSLLGYSTV